MRTELLKTVENNESLREEWNKLVLKMEVPQVFFTWEWASAVERAFRESLEPWIFTFKRGDQLVGIAALASVPSKTGKMFFLGASSADYCDILSAPEDRNEVVIALLTALGEHHVREVTFTNIAEESTTLCALALAQCSGFWPSSRIAYVCSRVVFQSSDATSKHATPELSAHLSKDEKFRRMSKLGQVSLVHLRDSTNGEYAHNPIVRAQVSRFLATSRLSPLLLPERQCFLSELIKLLGQAGWLDISILKVAGRDVAWNFGFRFAGVIFWYLPTFEMEMESLSPGACLLRMMTNESCQDPETKEIDLGLGDEGYKSRIANSSRTTHEFILSSTFMLHSSLAVKRILTRSIKAWSPLESVTRSILERGQRIKNAVASGQLSSKLTNRCRRFATKIFSRDEIEFFEWDKDNVIVLQSHPKNISLAPIAWDTLADAALRHHDDPEVLAYLMRSARRMRNSRGKSIRGYMLVNESGEALHYCWIADFGGFNLSEINHTLKPLSNAVMIFDCWTPPASRGMHYFRSAVECLAQELHQQGKTAWIFSALRNRPSLHALQESQFTYRYSLVRRKFVFRMPVTRLDAE